MMDSAALEESKGVRKQHGLTQTQLGARLKDLSLEPGVCSQQNQEPVIAPVANKIVGLCNKGDKPLLDEVVVVVAAGVVLENDDRNLKKGLALGHTGVGVPRDLELIRDVVHQVMHVEVLGLFVQSTKDGDGISKTGGVLDTIETMDLTDLHFVAEQVRNIGVLLAADHDVLRHGWTAVVDLNQMGEELVLVQEGTDLYNLRSLLNGDQILAQGENLIGFRLLIENTNQSLAKLQVQDWRLGHWLIGRLGAGAAN
jgi:hypothetical protein